MTYYMLMMLAVIFSALALFFLVAGHTWYASDCGCFVLAFLIAMVVRAIEE